jgi:uncharacterized protein
MRIISARTAAGDPLFRFFVLVFVLSTPFWLAGYLAAREGVPMPYHLPVSALQSCCPVAAASIVVWREGGARAVGRLIGQVRYLGRAGSRRWYLVVIFLMPCIMVLSYMVMRLSGTKLPRPHFAPLGVLALFLVYFAGAACEELGWTGYALVRMRRRRRWGNVRSSLVLGVVWAVWHYIPLLEAHRALTWIAWWSLTTVATRVIMVWLYDMVGGSVMAPILYHAMVDLTYSLFPDNGSYYNPAVTGVIEAFIAGAVIFTWLRETSRAPAKSFSSS